MTLVSGAVEIGTGALTGAAQILAEELGIDLADVDVADVDTEVSPFDYGAQGSRTAFSVGNACRIAAADLRAPDLRHRRGAVERPRRRHGAARQARRAGQPARWRWPRSRRCRSDQAAA